MIEYERRLDRDLHWALEEGSLHFARKSAVHQALATIARRLDEMGFPYAVVGAMACFFHGYRRFTEGVDLLVTREDWQTIREQPEQLGCVLPAPGSRFLRDAVHGVRVRFLSTGDYPGDDRPKPVTFPHPSEASHEIDGYRCLELPRLIELDLASGLANPGRLKDLGGVQELILVLGLPRELADQLHPFVREKYLELWEAVANNPPQPW